MTACTEPPTKASSSSLDPAAKYLVGAHYYSWFPETFNEGFLRGKLRPPQQPELGLYDNWQVEVAEQHISRAAEYGIDFFTLDYWPTKSGKDTRHETFLSASNIGDIHFCIFYETIDLGFDKVSDSTHFDSKKSARFVSDLEAIAQNYFDHPQYLQVQGRPMVVLYVTRTFAGDYETAIKEARRRLKLMGHDVFLVGDEVYWASTPYGPTDPKLKRSTSSLPQTQRIRLFDAITAYNFYQTDQQKHQGYGANSTFLKDVIDLSRRYSDATQGEVPVLPSVMPGYNDRGLRMEKNHYAIPRQWSKGAAEGTFLSEMFDQYALPFVNKTLPIIFVTSWNEWNEDTSVEPLASAPATFEDESGKKAFTQGYAYSGYGTTYLEVIRDKVIAVSGVVMTTQGPLRGTTVSAWNENTLIATDTTDSQGRFQLSRMTMPTGSYSVGLTLADAVLVKVGPDKTTTGLVLSSDQEIDKPSTSDPDLKPRRQDLNVGLDQYIEAFPRADYQIKRNGKYRYYVDDFNHAIKNSLRADKIWAEPHIQELLRQLLKPGDIVLDVGAHIGTHTTLIANLVSQDGVVYAFEPDLKSYRELVQNLRLNAVTNAIALRVALGSRIGAVEMDATVAGTEGGTRVARGGAKVELRTLDSYRFEGVDMIKIDQRSYQEKALNGAVETLRKDNPILLFEVGDLDSASQDATQHFQQTKGLLTGLGYQARKTGHHHYLAVPVGEQPDRLWLDLGQPENRRYLLSGFSFDEQDVNTSFNWSNGVTSLLSVPIAAPSSSPYTLAMRVRAFTPIAPVTAQVSLNNLALGTFTIGPEWSGKEFTVPANVLKAGENLVRFQYKKTEKPSRLLKASTDDRDLALRFDALWLAPTELPLPAKPQQAKR